MVGAFLIGWPSIVAVILNYVYRRDVRGTWLEAHFRWQIRTFWYGVLWFAACLAFVFVTFGIGLFVIAVPLTALGIWFIYRIARGWLRLADRRSPYD